MAGDLSHVVAVPMSALLAIAALLLLSGCVGMVNDYSTAANAFGQEATRNTITQLSRKHDTEAAAYAAAYCGQPRIGAVERRYRDPAIMHLRLRMCSEEARIGFGGAP